MPPLSEVLPYLVHLGAMCYLICFLFRDQLMLRIFAVIGDVFYTAYYFEAAGQPLWSAIAYSSLNIVINLVMMAMILQDRRQLPLGDNDLRLYQSFAGMTPGDFRRLSRLGKWQQLNTDTVLTEEGKPLDRLYYVLEGDVEIKKGERHIPVQAGIFIGEVAFLKKAVASATVTAKRGAHFISWSHDELAKALSRHDSLNQSFGLLLSGDLAGKVARS